VTLKQLLKRICFYVICLSAGVFFTTCGLEEYYYLPQVPEINIKTVLNTSATINLPPLTSFYYAQSYKIYYRIYISDLNTSSNETAVFNSISTTLASDYNAIYPNTDPTSTTSGTPADTLFNNRSYYELELDGADISNFLSISGGNIFISFPTRQGGYPVLSLNNGDQYRLKRSGKLISPKPADRYFQNTADLSAPENANSNNNADVAGRYGLSRNYAYASMYVAAMGTDQSSFTPIFSKPTFISVFRLPDNL